jgi:hypothetical protein
MAGAYQLGRSNAGSTRVAAAAAPAGLAVAPAAPPASGALPAGHPAPAEPQREGKVGADPTQKFTHFRVGNKNVKRMFVDGDKVWVGTSGGAVRYDTRTTLQAVRHQERPAVQRRVPSSASSASASSSAPMAAACRCSTRRPRSGKRSTSPRAWATPSSTTC